VDPRAWLLWVTNLLKVLRATTDAVFEHTDKLEEWVAGLEDPPFSVIVGPYQEHFEYSQAARHAISRRYKPTPIRTLRSSFSSPALLVSGSR